MKQEQMIQQEKECLQCGQKIDYGDFCSNFCTARWAAELDWRKIK